MRKTIIIAAVTGLLASGSSPDPQPAAAAGAPQASGLGALPLQLTSPAASEGARS